MKFLLSILFLGLATTLASAQCSVNNPCVQVNITNSAMAATVTTNSGGVEISGPGTATLYKCFGSLSVCSQAALTAELNGGDSPWNTVSVIPQTTASISYNDPVPYSSLVNYVALNTWTGGAAGPVSSVATFQVPQAPQVTPGAPSAIKLSEVTSGSTGKQ